MKTFPLAIHAALFLFPAAFSFGAINITISEVSGNVVASYTGTYNTAASLSSKTQAPSSGIIATDAGTYNSVYLSLGNRGGGSTDGYTVRTTGPTSFGIDGTFQSAPGQGDVFMLFPFNISSNEGDLAVPLNYVSGTTISGSMTFNGTTLATMGLTQGTYNWTVGNNDLSITDTVSLNVVPEPASSAALLAMALCFSMAARRRL